MELQVNDVEAVAVDSGLAEREAARLYGKLRPAGYEWEDCRELAPLVVEIQQLKQQHDILVLCHHFMTPDLIHGIADVVADASVLVETARQSRRKNILVCAIRPLAEAVKIVNPRAQVLLPNIDAGCSIADGITAADVRRLRAQHPDAAAVAYINSSAAVKAESDVVVTSKNARELIGKLPQKKILFYPDRAIAVNLQKELPLKEIVVWNGRCIVHEEYTIERIMHFRKQHPETHVLFHSECDPAVIPLGHMHGGTHAMIEYVERHPEVRSFFMVTECGIADTLRVKHPDREFIGTCALCPYMKSINVINVLQILKGESDRGEVVEIPPAVAPRATRAMEKMYRMVEC